MAMGRRKREDQASLGMATADLPKSGLPVRQAGGPPFYEQVNRILDTEEFDRHVEALGTPGRSVVPSSTLTS